MLVGEVVDLLLRFGTALKSFLEPLLLLFGLRPQDFRIAGVRIEHNVVWMRNGLSQRWLIVSQSSGSYSMRRAHRPAFSAAIRVEPEPPKQSSTSSPRREQSLIASAINATGLTVGCIASSSLREPLMLLINPAMPGYDLAFVRDQYGVGKPEPLDRARYLLDLLPGVGARVRAKGHSSAIAVLCLRWLETHGDIAI